MKCYICQKEITERQLQARKALSIGQGLYRHEKCGLKLLDNKKLIK